MYAEDIDITENTKICFVNLLNEEFILQQLVSPFVKDAEKIYQYLSSRHQSLYRVSLEEQVGFTAVEAFGRLDLMRDYTIP